MSVVSDSQPFPYRVQLDLFQGPLDLLLYLVRREEIDPRDLPVSKITTQFLDFLTVLQVIDLDLVGEFVVLASTLAEIKSRLVLPSPDAEIAPEEAAAVTGDPRSDLVRQLLEYKRFKEAASHLEERAAQWQERYPRLADDRPRVGKDPARDRIKEVELWDLVSALGRILRRKDADDETTVKNDETPIHVYVDRIGAMIREQGEVRFFSLFEGEYNRSRIVGMFLAVLELLRHHHFRAHQEDSYGDIIMWPPLEGDAPAEAAPALIEPTLPSPPTASDE